LRFLRDWRHHKGLVLHAAESIYESSDANDNDDDVNVVEQMELEPINEQDIKEHEEHWRRLLLEIFKAEAPERAPVFFFLPTNEPSAVIVRHGCISVVTREEQGTPLDKAAQDVLARVSKNAAAVALLGKAEQEVLVYLGRGALALEPELAEKTRAALNRAMDGVDLGPVTTDLNKVPRDQLKTTLRASLAESSLAGLCVLSKATEALGALRHHGVLSMQNQIAAESLVVRAADAARRLHLGRFLALSKIGSDLAGIPLLLYLHTLNVMCVSTRTAPTPPVLAGNEEFQKL